MRFFSKKRKTTRLMAVNLASEGVYAASVRRPPSAMPELKFFNFYPKSDKPLPEQLEKIGKDVAGKDYRCSLMLLPGEYQLFSVDALNVPQDELKTAMRWRLKDMLDYHIDDATIDVLDVPGDKNAGGRGHSLYAVAARNQLIAERQSLFFDAQLPLAIIDIPDMAQRNISALLETEGRGLALLSFDEYGGLLTVSYGGELYLSRRLDVRLPQLLSEDVDKKIAAFERITLELQRSLDHFDRLYNFIATARLVLAPLGAVAAELQAYLASNLYLPVEILKLESVLDLSKTPALLDAGMQRAAFMTIGAALRQEETVL
ncbi:MAG: agglutinin biogenesis protein MshI [Burkholderiales bacterium]|nr:agglutinin biogenesis protein MshI [Burkholderiales bacterium]